MFVGRIVLISKPTPERYRGVVDVFDTLNNKKAKQVGRPFNIKLPQRVLLNNYSQLKIQFTNETFMQRLKFVVWCPMFIFLKLLVQRAWRKKLAGQAYFPVMEGKSNSRRHWCWIFLLSTLPTNSFFRAGYFGYSFLNRKALPHFRLLPYFKSIFSLYIRIYKAYINKKHSIKCPVFFIIVLLVKSTMHTKINDKLKTI